MKVHRIINSKYSLILILSLAFHGCYYDVEEELYPGMPCDTTNVSYMQDIVPVLSNNGCLGCHGDLATISLNTYTDLKVYADNGRLLGSIKHEEGYRSMPDNMPKIDACAIHKIEAWITQGSLNN